MRKRSEVAASTPAPVAAPPPVVAQTMVWTPPPHVSVKDGVVFLSCQCGGKISYDGATQLQKEPHCMLCNADLDPNRELTKDRLEMLSRMKTVPSQPGVVNLPVPEVVKKIIAEDISETCSKCGVRLTVTALGKFYPCGHGTTNATNQPASIPAQVLHTSPTPKEIYAKGSEIGQTFKVTFGEMSFAPVQYTSFRVGPFEATGVVLAGETLVTAMKRVHDSLVQFAEIEFPRKQKQFADALERVGRK